MTLPPALSLYRAAAFALGPFLSGWLALRTAARKEDGARRNERYGRALVARPPGKLVWLHGASVGELGVVLQVQEGLAARDPALSFLVTTGTRTSADLFQRRAPDALHQYAPLDRIGAVRRFLAHWRPDLGIFVESEIWPNLVLEAQRAGVPLALVNARMNPPSMVRWARMSRTAAHLLGAFDPILAADARTAESLTKLSGRPVEAIGNLKLAAAPPRVDEAALAALRAEIGGRKIWLGASTHIGEERILLEVHENIRRRHPAALLILAVRHPERGADVSALAHKAPRRSQGAAIGDAPVFILDTIGELSMFYAASPVSLVAGSLQEGLKGHNPIEPAKLGSSILAGPHVESFADIYEALHAAGGAWRVDSQTAIEDAVLTLWSDASAREAMIAAARAVAEAGAPALETTLDALVARLAQTAPGRTRAHAAA